MLGEILPLYSIIPFVGILLSIAIFPLVAPEFWRKHFTQISLFWAIILAIPFIYFYKLTAAHEILHTYFLDYIPFIILLWSLYTISGGIHISGNFASTPIVNTIFLFIGSFLASAIGTTGASMLLIRPFIKTNQIRKHKAHQIIFFIFLVSNIGGSLTPLGDPPLFLGFLHGVPFFWTLKLFPFFAFTTLLLLGLFYIIDLFYYKKENTKQLKDKTQKNLELKGVYNFIFFLGVLFSIILFDSFDLGHFKIFEIKILNTSILRNITIVLMGILSLKFTPKDIREAHNFDWFPIKEVAYLFFGIFTTMIPVLLILKAGNEGNLAFIINKIHAPYQYFWATGTISSFLDNAPTYLTFFNTVLGNLFTHEPEREAVNFLITNHAIYLKAISIGAVFMGANTYIGNAPNFMVKSIAESYNIKMPSFFGYMFKYSIPILIPIFIIITFVFFI
jgi:Na+/H+ antiporter NhaD/arsenite permease-like protein